MMDLEIEWGFQTPTEKLPFDGHLAVYNGLLGEVKSLPGDAGTVVASDRTWQSQPRNTSRRGISVRLLWLGTTQNTTLWPQQARLENADRTILTVFTKSGSFSFLPADLETGPLLAPENGFFVRATDRRPATSRQSPEGLAPQRLLCDKIPAVAGSPKVRGWGSNDTPWFGTNPASHPIKVQTFTLPARSVAMHPGSDRPVAVAWRSPIQGHVRVKARVADADPTGGNGIAWSITHDSRTGRQVLGQGTINNGGAQAIPRESEAGRLSHIAVAPGDLLSLIVDARGGDNSCDTTTVELLIRAEGKEPRRWDLTQDVVDSIHAGNPHADAFGHQNVWHYYMPENDSHLAPVLLLSHAVSARQFQEELAARKLKTIRQRVREHPEQTWEGAMQALHPSGNWPAYPRPEFEPPARIQVPDQHLTDAWRCGAWHLLRVLKKDPRGRWIMRDYPYDALAHESFLIIRALDLQGMHEAARDGLARWLERDEKQPLHLDGMFTDSQGILSGVDWDWQHLGGPGLMQWQMVEHALFTGDKNWLARAAPRLCANADWIIRQRLAYPQGVPNGDRLWTHGLLPPHNIWDSTNWRPWYESNANYWLGLKHYAEVIAEIDPPAGRKYRAEAEAYARDILAAVERSLVLSPLVRVADGTYRSFLPPAPYMRGPASRCMPTSFGSPEHTPGLYPDVIRGGVHLLNLSGLLGPNDSRAQGLLDVLEDRLLLEHHRLPMRTEGYDPQTPLVRARRLVLPVRH